MLRCRVMATCIRPTGYAVPMHDALHAWLKTANATPDPLQAAEAAARAVSHDSWSVVRDAGSLARSRLTRSETSFGITASLTRVSVTHPSALATVSEGDVYPAFDGQGRKRRGAFDTPIEMARATVNAALQAARRPVERAVDPACGAGAFLLALSERVDCEIVGIDLDPIAAVVAAVAVPQASIVVGDGLLHRAPCDLLVGNPPFIAPEHQNKAVRARLRRAMPWLSGRFDLAVPFAAHAVECVRERGGVGLVLPESIMHQPYAKPLRIDWLRRHAIMHLSHSTPFPGAQVGVVSVGLSIGGGPAPLPSGIEASAVSGLPAAPLHPSLQPGDPELIRQIRSASRPLGDFATVDTGVVSHGSHGSKRVLLHDTPAPTRVPYVDARDLVENRTRWLDYRPDTMHRAKTPELFEHPKVLVQRIRGRGAIRAWVDRSGLYAGHTLTVVRPDRASLSPEAIQALITDPLIDGLIRMERGSRLDLYPRDVRSIPVPLCWLTGDTPRLSRAFGLSDSQVERILDFGHE